MRKWLLLIGFVTSVTAMNAALKKDIGILPDSAAAEIRKVKTGWNFGVLPSIAYDADLGFQGGLLGNVYFYGDGTQY